MRILLLGEVGYAADYLRCVLDWHGWQTTHVPADTSLDSLDGPYDIFVISDYPASAMGAPVRREIATLVSRGKGLLMVGGWSSFTGRDGHYGPTDIGGVLPVECIPEDDRLAEWSGMHLARLGCHEITHGLDWDHPPVICGLNRAKPKPNSTTLVEAYRCAVSGTQRTAPMKWPLLVVSGHGEGRVSAYLSDLLPHWCGGLVDWGERRVESRGYEFGVDYVMFVGRLVSWTARLALPTVQA
jgi:uncharacterized membrane protein